MIRIVLVLALAIGAQETVILQTAPPTPSQQFNQAMRDLGSTFERLGAANRAQASLSIQQADHDLAVKRFELDVLDRAIRFEKDYPGEPNPYREFLKSMQPPPPPPPSEKDRVGTSWRNKESGGKRQGTNPAVAVAAVIGLFLVVGIASSN